MISNMMFNNNDENDIIENITFSTPSSSIAPMRYKDLDGNFVVVNLSSIAPVTLEKIKIPFYACVINGFSSSSYRLLASNLPDNYSYLNGTHDYRVQIIIVYNVKYFGL